MKKRIFLLAVAAALWTTAVGQTKTIVEQQCWLDGHFSAAQPASANVDISALAPGVHTYSIRVKDSEGIWSPLETKFFVIPHLTEQATGIVEREYWLDGHFASHTAQDASTAQISLIGLHTGLHYLTMHVKDNRGIWSSTDTRFFIVPASLGPVTVARYMYWFDDDQANLVSGELTSDAGVLPVEIANLSEGEHTLSWRVADSKGVWSNTMVETFTFTPVPSTDPAVGEQVQGAKVLIDGQVYILRGDKIFIVTGSQVK